MHCFQNKKGKNAALLTVEFSLSWWCKGSKVKQEMVE